MPVEDHAKKCVLTKVTCQNILANWFWVLKVKRPFSNVFCEVNIFQYGDKLQTRHANLILSHLGQNKTFKCKNLNCVKFTESPSSLLPSSQLLPHRRTSVPMDVQQKQHRNGLTTLWGNKIKRLHHLKASFVETYTENTYHNCVYY